MRTTRENLTRHALPCQAQEALRTEYTRRDGHKSLDALSQGETDVLNRAREALGWPTLTSLAHKYYKLYPDRKWWQRALERCARQTIRTTTLNIVYLLHALETVKAMAMKAAFSGKGVLNRLVHSTNSSLFKETNRLVPERGTTSSRREDQGINPLPQRIFRAGALT